MAQLSSIIEYLDNLLKPQRYADEALNGLQVEADAPSVSRIAVAVDAGLSIIEQATEGGADLLIVHHGLYWGNAEAASGVMGRKLKLLFKCGCSLYASHLPLDGNPEIGNAVELARALGLQQVESWAEYEGSFVGARGQCTTPHNLGYFVSKTAEITGTRDPLILDFGPEKITKAGIVTGSGAFALTGCSRDEIDLLISGEPKHAAYHLAKELEVNAIFAGHYATETLGVKAVAKKLEKHFDVESFFIDEPTGI